MALVKRQNANSKTISIAVVILVVAGLGFFLYQKFVLQAGLDATPHQGGAGSQAITSFGESLLNDGKFTGLKSTTITPSVNVSTDAGQPQPFK